MRRVMAIVLAAGLIGGCASETATPSPSPVGSATATPLPQPTTSAAAPSAPSPTPTSTPTSTPDAGTPEPPAPSASLPAPGVRAAVEGTLIAAGRDGILYVSVPRRGGSVLAALGPDGRPQPGWPITVPKSTACVGLLPVADGSVRVICDGTDLPVFEISPSDQRAFAFGPDARPLPGWPVRVPFIDTARVVDTDLVLVADVATTDVEIPDEPSHDARLIRVHADGRLEDGAATSLLPGCCGGWSIAPDGVAWAAGFDSWDGDSSNPPRGTTVNALDMRGVRTGGGWPARVPGLASGPGFAPDGRLLLEIGSAARSDVVVRTLDAASGALGRGSDALPLDAVDIDSVDCGGAVPEPPIVDGDGNVFLFSPLDDRIHGLDASLATRAGWPIRIPGSLATPGISEGGLDCFAPVRPVPDGRGGVLLLLAARNEHVGGAIVAIDHRGVRAGWPVELRRPGAAFWDVDVADDGTAYALAVEPEGRRWSSTIVALAPDSTVRYRATILEP